jgi:2-oxoisovalerate dehydrogenase E1 component
LKRTDLLKAKLLEIYEKMLRVRRFEETVAELWARGRIPGIVHLYVGMEAIAVGACANLRLDDYVTSTHRGHGHCIAKGVSMDKMMAELLGKKTGCCKGKGGSMHLVDLSVGLLGCTGIVGSAIPIATGAGLSIKLRETDQSVACFLGDSAINAGAFHEGMNLASLWKLPVVFVCENNLYGLSTSISRSTATKDLLHRAAAYDMPGAAVDGMDVLAVHDAMQRAVQRARKGGGPTFLECKTYRFKGHMEGDPKGGLVYRKESEVAAWKKRDPIDTLRRKLFQRGILTEKQHRTIEQNVASQVEAAVLFAEQSPYPEQAEAVKGVFSETSHRQVPFLEKEDTVRHLDLRSAINEALREEMRRDKAVFVMGEDIAGYGGIFKCTEGLLEEFGEQRVRDTPLSEAAIVGAAIGAAATGLRPVAEIMFEDWIDLAMDQICNQLAKMRYMSGGQIRLPVVIRAAGGSRCPLASGGAQHSQSLEAWFMHIPGLTVVTPATPYDAKGLLKTAIRGDDPALFFEPKLSYYKQVARIYPSVTGPVPERDYTIPFGIADIKRKGRHATIVAVMMMVHKALAAGEELAKEGIEVEVIDPRTLVPLDKNTVIESVKKTGRLIVATEDCRTCGVGSEIAAMISEEAVDYLEAPIKRVAAPDVPVPYSPPLEKVVIPDENTIIGAVKEVVG